MIGNLEGVIFENWNQIDTIPKDAKLVGRGMDFGYTNDPTTMVDVYQWNGEYIFDEVMYAKQKNVRQSGQNLQNQIFLVHLQLVLLELE